nr:hypothetical protein [Kibdelosporangium sp. MJ126-NF4]CEL23051.1 hypothetical protein [Kibdelosporangium sp. MJ126-NF4]CTQ90189.1 hypothetical protein [Kibdelosporangium sp. MJ126-NF4]
MDGHTVRAIAAFRNEFGGGLREAMVAIDERARVLRHTRPHGYAAGRG